MSRAFIAVGLVTGLFPLLAGSSAAAQEEDGAFDRTPRDCIILSRLDKTDAIDDQNILFHMRGRDQIYRNHLPRKCPGLARENRIAYRTTAGRLCSIDTITVLEQYGVGFRDGFTCRLGEFVPLSPAEIEELKFTEDGRSARSAVETTEVELPELESAETESPAGEAQENER